MSQGKSVLRPEPWLRGTLPEIPAIVRGVIHALQLADEDLHKWAGGLTDEEMNLRPSGVAPVAFHIRHIARSLDRLLTYAEGRTLSVEQTALLRSELELGAGRDEVLAEVDEALKRGIERVRLLGDENLDEKREVGGKRLATTLGGLLVHMADHTQRHVGQAIVTAKIVLGGRG